MLAIGLKSVVVRGFDVFGNILNKVFRHAGSISSENSMSLNNCSKSSPFGATRSMAAFLRLAASIAFIGVKFLHLAWTVFFDDFTCVIPESLLPLICF